MACGVVVSCEHASNAVPDECRWLFASEPAVLATHEAYDLGAAALARDFAVAISDACGAVAEDGAAPVLAAITRLLCDLNRSEDNPELWSRFARRLSFSARNKLLETYYRPFRARVLERVESFRASGRPVLHLSIHSFTPVLHGCVRNLDLGILYDPRRSLERTLAESLLRGLAVSRPGLRVQANAPYRGDSDGHTTALRRMFSNEEYIGFELEFNQAWPCTAWGNPGALVPEICRWLIPSLDDRANALL